jgi:hypothetical protein
MDGPSGAPVPVEADGSFKPLLTAKRLICLDIFLLPHLGQAGGRAGLLIHALRQEAENPAALRTGKFVNRHWDLRFTIHD